MCLLRRRKSKTYKYLFVLITIIGLSYYKFKFKNNHLNEPDERIILWWTDFVDFDHKRTCGELQCFITHNRSYFDHPELKSILFYASNMNTTDFPLPRKSQHIWGLLHDESPKNVPYIMFNSILNLFNYTSTFSRYSDVPLTNSNLNSLMSLATRKYLTSVEDKNRLQMNEKLAPILYVQSICDTMSRRDEFVTELMNHIQVDCYGKCLNNKKMPESLSNDYLATIDSLEFYKFISRYKFVIAYENSVCNDYITEKLWRPLIIGTVPIYFGSPTIRDWLPNKKSAVLIDDFKSAKDLAQYILFLNDNDSEYLKYLEHKYSEKSLISNNRLRELINDRRNFEMLESFECLMCRATERMDAIKIANQNHYDCKDSALKYPVMLANSQKNGNWNIRSSLWRDSVDQGKCEANVLSDFIVKNVKFTDAEFSSNFMKAIMSGYC